jgi:hypothetical protein
MNNKYPTVAKVISEPTHVEVNMENVVHVEPNYQKIPLVIHLVPHDGRIYLHFSGIAGNHIEIEEQSANSCYISFKN